MEIRTVNEDIYCSMDEFMDYLFLINKLLSDLNWLGFFLYINREVCYTQSDSVTIQFRVINSA